MMKLIKDLGMLQVSGKIKRRIGVYECSDCKRHFEAMTDNIKASNQERCNSCASKLRAKKHGMRKHPLNTTINNMVQRCENPKREFYPDYGGRGIKVCEEWRNSRETFFNWAIQNGWEEGLTLDRIDNDGNYEPSNCRWVTPTIQSRNKRMPKNNTSGYKGVYFKKDKDKYVAQICVNKNYIYLGYFKTAIEAGVVYNNYIIENNLEGFILNEIPQQILIEKENTNGI